MRISSITNINNKLHKSTIIDNKFITYSSNDSNNMPIMYYPNSYYINFKGYEVKSEVLKNFINHLDDFYSTYKGVSTQNLFEILRTSVYLFDYNYMIFDEFLKRADRIFKNNKHQAVKQDVIIHSLEKINKTIKNRNKIEALNNGAETFLKTLNTDLNLPENIEIIPKTNDYRAYIDNIINRFMELSQVSPKTPRWKFLQHLVRNQLNEDIDKATPPIFTELVLDKLKHILKEEDFMRFDSNIHQLELTKDIRKNEIESLKNELYFDMREHKVSPFNNQKFYQYWENKTPAEIDFQLQKVFRYGLDEVNFYYNQSLSTNKYRMLLLDPGFVCNLESLKSFVEKFGINPENLSPFEFRQKFSEYLGNETIYRGMYGENPENLISKLKEEGCIAKPCFDKEFCKDMLNFYLDPMEQTHNLLYRLDDKIQNRRGTEFLSVTSEYDIAASVPKLDGKSSSPVVVVKTEIPTLSLIKQKGLFRNKQYHSIGKSLIIGNKFYNYNRNQEKIEAFIPFYLPLNKNTEYLIDTTTSSFYWY